MKYASYIGFISQLNRGRPFTVNNCRVDELILIDCAGRTLELFHKANHISIQTICFTCLYNIHENLVGILHSNAFLVLVQVYYDSD